MTDAFEKKEKRFLYLALLVSILFHLGLLVLLQYWDVLNLQSGELQASPEKQPLTVEFVQPPQPPQPVPEERFYELKENKNANEAQPQNTPFLAEKASRSAAPLADVSKASPAPKADVLTKTQPRETPSGDALVKETAGDEPLLAYNSAQKFNRRLLSSDPLSQESGEEPRKLEGKSEVLQRDFDAELIGDFALSTYAWEWAPYMREFLKKLKRVWFAPPAYYQLGLIHGYTIVQFSITRDGQLKDLKVVRHTGHVSLEESSVNAVQSTFPFLPLPKNFPDPELKIKLKMIYPDLRAYSPQ